MKNLLEEIPVMSGVLYYEILNEIRAVEIAP
jgi:hypothetical protein